MNPEYVPILIVVLTMIMAPTFLIALSMRATVNINNLPPAEQFMFALKVIEANRGQRPDPNLISIRAKRAKRKLAIAKYKNPT